MKNVFYLQATVGTCVVPKPGMMDFVGKAKWEAWKAVGDIPQVSKTYNLRIDDLLAPVFFVSSQTLSSLMLWSALLMSCL